MVKMIKFKSYTEKFYVKNPKKIKFWLGMCKISARGSPNITPPIRILKEVNV